MLVGIPKQEKKERLRQMKWALKTHNIKFKNEPFHIQKMYKRLMAQLEKKGDQQ